jgi:heme-degrading monooxygenase HmoA
VSQLGTLRLFTFRPVRAGFDALLRDTLLPDLVGFRELEDLHVGRQGPDDLGPRLVASVWSSRDAMIEAVGEDFDPPAFHPEYLSETTDHALDIVELMASLRFGAVESEAANGIIRVARGRVQPGALELYRDMVLRGTCADVQAGHGPIALYLARRPDDDCFVTLSVWGSWAAIERATGGDASHPISTRNMDQMVEWHVEHYEAVPNLERPRVTVTA